MTAIFLLNNLLFKFIRITFIKNYSLIIQMNKEKIVINIGKDKMVTLTFSPFDTDLDLNDLTTIHYENLYGEMTTISTLLNKVGILQADIEAAVKDSDFELAVYRSKLYEMYRKKLTRVENYVRKDGSKIVEPGNTELENSVYLDEGYQLKYKENIRMHKNLDYIKSLYWSLKSKDDKLSAMMKGVVPEEFQSGIIEGVINTIFIKNHKNVLPQKP